MDVQVKGARINAADSEKAKALQAALAQIEKQFGKGTIMRLGEGEAIEDIQVVSTGSLGLDIALGVGGLPRGRVIEIYGPESSGKTTLTLQVIAEMQKLGGQCAFVDAEHAEPRFGLPVGGLFSGVGNKYVIDSYLPTSSTLTIVDTLHGLTFVMIFVIIAFSALILQQSENNKLKNLAESTNKIVAWSIAIIYFLINAISIALAVWN